MTVPQPVPGLIVSFSFLWAEEAERGLQEGQKDRPCVVLAAYDSEHGKRAILVPVTHTAPHDPTHAIAVPAALKAMLGLDDAPAWIVCGEWNVTDWPGFDLRQLQGGQAASTTTGSCPADSTKRCVASRSASTTPARPRKPRASDTRQGLVP